MSPLLITLLVVAGIVVLIAIGYFNHIVENNKLERARRKADLSDRLRRCENLSEAFPGQLMSPPLKLLLTRLQLYYLEQLLPLDKGNAALRPRMQELQAQIGLGDAIKVGNPPRQILNEAMAKEARFQLEGLHGQIAHANQIGVLGAAESKNWSREIRHLLNLLHIELFSNMGMAFLQQNQPGQARLAFERGVQYLTKQPDRERYQQQMQLLQRQLQRANALVLQQTAPSADEHSELADGLEAIEGDDEWKKKNIYD
ncbi:hypothetical protein [Pseudomonas mangrovi]|uniref:Uncharacterized protein n=1 Tax=Pseudomonas mangrovi TaxID=2161748 RepID=A0A2T5P7Z7_9PSED|nr:hypothetical protein [Pseudomonas mangrovi]PTU73872.1 hypothetical protein DBO85_14395 [Pseudomonas mangrovi]